MPNDSLIGRITRHQSGFYTVMCGETRVVCQLRGKLKRQRKDGDIAAVGDFVRIERLQDGSGVIEDVLPRESALVRLAPTARGVYRQIMLANPDQVVIVFSCAHPSPHLRMLDRFLVVAEKQDLPPLIVANKVDLVGLERAQEMFRMYPPLGYPVVFTSAHSGLGVDELHDRLTGRLSALAGPSGVGKSSLLNAVQPDLGLAVREVSGSTNKGRHTTVVREMFPLREGGFVVDLPGIRMLALWDTEPEELDGYFPELRELVADCQFNDCTHQFESGCAVRAAVETGQVHRERYVSYLRLRFGVQEEAESVSDE